jgi:transcriptional regulator with XRE-family HTH domain
VNYFTLIRKNAGFSRKEAAINLKISWYHLRNIECNQKFPSKDLIIKMSEVYQCNPIDILKASQKNLASYYSN